MTANRLSASASTPTSGADYMDDVAAEIIALWARSADTLTNVAGTNAITAKASVSISAYTAGLAFWLIPVNANTGAVTVNVDGVGVTDLLDRAGDPLVANALEADGLYLIVRSGSAFRLFDAAPTASSALVGADIQQFDLSGTWTKPADFPDDAIVEIEAWGAGGGGGGNGTGGGGGGGGYKRRTMTIGDLGATETVTVGTSAISTAGGNSSFGSHVTAYGGGAGANSASGGGGGGGGLTSAGASGSGSTGGAGGGPNPGAADADAMLGGGGGGTSGATEAGGKALHGGGGGGAGDAGSPAADGGESLYGGGGGGGESDVSTDGVGGVSIYGGNGGDSGVAGAAPAGGGGRNAAGGAGRVIVRVWAAADAVAGPQGAIGETGGGVVIPYTFSTTTTDSDPGAGIIRLDQATQNTATVLRCDLLDADGADRTTLLDSLDDSTSTIKGHLRLFSAADPTKFILWTLASLANPNGYRNLTVAVVSYSAANPFTDAENVVLSFARTGDAGATSADDIMVTALGQSPSPVTLQQMLDDLSARIAVLEGP